MAATACNEKANLALMVTQKSPRSTCQHAETTDATILAEEQPRWTLIADPAFEI